MDLLGETRSRDSPALLSSPKSTSCSAAVVEVRMYHASFLPLAHRDVLGCPLQINHQPTSLLFCLSVYLSSSHTRLNLWMLLRLLFSHAERISGECHLAHLFICSCLLLIYTNLFEKCDDCCLKKWSFTSPPTSYLGTDNKTWSKGQCGANVAGRLEVLCFRGFPLPLCVVPSAAGKDCSGTTPRF